MEDGRCFICLNPATERCINCLNERNEDVWYCCEEHLLLHRKKAKEGGEETCYPIKVMRNENVGRYLVATRDIRAGEILFEEVPLAVGPNAISTPQCILCHCKTDWSTHCEGCSYPVCSQCISTPPHESCHSKLECDLLAGLHDDIPLSEIKSNIAETTKIMLPNVMYEPVIAIRLLLLRNTEPNKYLIAQTLMDHNEERKSISTEYWDHSVTTVINPIVQSFMSKNLVIDISFEEVSKVVGICEVNNYEIYNIDNKTGYRAVLPVTSLLTHSCRSNCRPIIKRKYPYDNRCFANVDIPKGTELTINYTASSDPTAKRISALKSNWYFECNCTRCSNPDDTESNLEALKCTTCCKEADKEKSGYFRRKINYKDEYSNWECDECGQIKDNASIESLVENLQKEKEGIDQLNIPALMDFIKKAEKQLHVNHHLLTTTRRWVIPLLCRPLRIPNEVDVRTSFTPEMYKQKIDLCQKQLNVLDICQPGLTKRRGKVLYEMADSVMRYHNSNFQCGKLETLTFVNELKKCSKWLEESVKCLRMEREETFERYICSTAEGLLNEATGFIAFME